MNDDDDDGNVLVRKEDPTFAPYEAMKINPYNLPSRSRSTRIVRKPAKYVYSSGEENNNEDSVEKEDGKEKQPNEEETPIAFTSEAVVAPSTALVDTATAKTLAANVNGAMELEVQVTATLRSKKDNAIVSSTTQSSTVELENVTNELVVMSATRTAVLDAMSPNPSSSPSSSSKEIELRGRAPEIGVVAAAETLLTLPVAAATQPASCDVNTASQTVPMPDSLDPPRTKTGSMLDAVNPLAAKTGLMPDPVNPFATETGAVPDSVNPSATKSDPISGPPNPSATKPVFEVNTSSAINHESQTVKTQTIEARSMSRPRRNARKPARFLDDGETENHSTHIPDKSEMTKKTRGRRKKRKSDEDDEDWKPAEKFIKTETSFPGLQSTDPPLPNLVLPKPEPVTPVSSGASTPAVSDPPLPNLVLPKPEPVTPVSSGASTFAVLDPPLLNLVLPKPETVTPVSSRTTTIPVLDLPSPNLVLPQPELVTPGSTNSHSVAEDKTSLPLSTGANRNVQFINSTKPATATSLVVYGNGFDVLDSSKVPSAINEEIVCDDGTDSSDRRKVIYDGPPRTTSPIAISDESDDAVAAPTVLSSDNSPDVSVTKITTNKRRSSSRDKKDPVYVIDSDDDFDLPDVSAMFARFDRPAPQPSATVKTLTVKATPSGMITAATVRKASASFGVTEKPSASFGASEKSSASVGVTEKPAGKAGKGKGKSKGKNAKGKTNWTPDDDSISTPSTGLCGSASGRATHFGTRGTLIVCPLSVLSNWVDQLEEHVDARVHLAIYSYYGPQRCKRVALLEKQDIVLTTYMTLATDWREANNPKTMTKSPLHEVKWLRVVLDEGHIIRNPKAQQTKAIVDLTAERRWVLTGTPIQNSIKDFWSLMNFLRVKPFTDHTWWSRTIERPITRGEESAFRRVQHLMTNVALRRTKNQIVDGRPLVALPSRTVVKETIALSDEERKIYDAMHTEGRLIISRYCRQGTLLHHYGEVLTILLRLRQICCHPFLVTKAAKVSMQTAKDLAASSRGGADDADVPEAELRQRLINNLLAVLSSGSDEECSVCLDSLKDAVITHCAHVFCRACIVGALRAADGGATSGPCPLCRAPVDERRLVNVPPESERPAEPVVIQTDNGPWHSSAKVDACMKALLAVREEDASLKSIVVSQFTSYLTVLETPLRTNGFKFVRFDGTMSQKQRTTAIEVFSDPDPASPTIFLMSLKAGGVGLNLTAASRVFLLDPAWNPASEEQCFDRCHRLGQTRDVIITKFIIEDSVEERMLELQEKKRRLAQGAFAKKQTAAERRQMRTADIQNLMSITTADVNQAVGPMVPLGGGPVVTVNRNLRFV
ncbi:uncharacterized protein LOC141910879 [Tubulanus polymorphus]|uniref:uncharacterized protein LOC141910879 n=1 Tax=Tubulanus polymorphus TaxID=672921 RepID=UPI003DA267FE